MGYIIKLIAFVLLSVCLIWISRDSLHVPRSHGFFRFFSWEFILALFVFNVDSWFRDIFSWHQVISWFLLIISIIPLVFGVRSLTGQGNPVEKRFGEPQLLSFEKTTSLVDTGIYHYIRHPLYSSLLFLAWGIFFKIPSLLGALFAMAATLSLLATAKADETECILFFGPAYEAYMKKTKRFIPFLL
ncbi:MAG: isoprenylcysteine carboxylmethyltransferase family protein [Deltaproteobacteria bacterium]|nr:isoprenylcysteine carboxylmethyltransferase family protein [Deltaproteobacteria bacterium]